MAANTKPINFIPVKANLNDSGIKGDALECANRYYATGEITYKPAPQGDPDLVINGYTVEVKSGCGELSDTYKADFVAYCPDVALDIPAEKQTFIFSQAEWLAFLNGYIGKGSMVRMKNRTNGGAVETLQEFKTSRKKSDYIWESCFNKPTLAEWLQANQ